MKIWIIFIIIFGVLKGLREPIKKKVLESVNVFTSLFVYTFIGFLMTLPTAKGVFDITPYVSALIVAKSTVIFFAWMLTFVAIKKVPLGIYGITDMSRVIFSSLMGILFLGEGLTLRGIISLILVAGGLYLANKKHSDDTNTYSSKYTWMIMLSCFLNAVSGTLDKVIMSTGEVTSTALQFWFMLLLSALYLGYIMIKKENFEIRKAIKNPWIYVLSLLLILGDRALFIANSDPESKVTIMTLIKQCSAVVTIIMGRLLYKEKNTLKNLLCAGLIIGGIALACI